MIQYGIVFEVTNYEAKWTRVNLDSNTLCKIRIIIDFIESTSLGCYEVCQQMFSIWGTEGGETLFKWAVCKPRKPRKHILQKKLKVCSSETKWRPPFIEKVPNLVSDCFIFMQMRNLNHTVLIGPNSIVRFVGSDWLLWSHSNWSVQLQIMI